MRQPRGPVLFAATEQRHLAAINPGDDAITVELDFVYPLVAFGRLARERGQLRLDKSRQLAALRSSILPAATALLGLGLLDWAFIGLAARVLPAGFDARASHAPLPALSQTRSRWAAISPKSRSVLTLRGCSTKMSFPRRPASLVVALFEQEPVPLIARFRTATAHEHPTTVQLLAVQREFQSAGLVTLVRVAAASHQPRSQSMTVPPPYSPSGMMPSKSPYTTG